MDVSSCLVLIMIFGTAPTGSETFDETVLLATCGIESPEVPYLVNCTKTMRKVKFLEVEANANPTLVCRDVNYVVFEHNPGIFVIDYRLQNSISDVAMWVNGSQAIVRELWSGGAYEFNFYRVFADGISRNETTEMIKTMTGLTEPKPVENITLESLEVEAGNPFRMRSKISFTPGVDWPCFYEVFLFNKQNKNILYNLENLVKLETVFSGLEFDVEYTIQITGLTRRYLESHKKSITFKTPTCLEVYENLTMCAPEEVSGFRAEAIYKMANIFDVKLTWDKPNLLPDYYTVQLFLVYSEVAEPLIQNVSGTANQTVIPDVEILDQYDVTIRAFSSGGKGPRIVTNLVVPEIDMTLTEISTASKVGGIFMILLGISGLIFGSSAYGYHWYKNRQQMQSRAEYIKDVEESGPILAGVTDKPRPIDEYEIRPDRLEINQFLGSGAFGIVKFGNLRDDRGQVTKVAVKMLRDDPSEEDQRGFELEMNMMKSAGHHPNIVSLLGCCTIGPKPLLIVEYCSQGDLQSFLRAKLVKATVWVLEKRKQCVPGKNLAENGEEGLSPRSDRGDDGDVRVTSAVANCVYDIDQDSIPESDTVTVTDLLNFARQVATGMEFLSSNRVVHRDLAARNVLVCKDRTVKISDFGLSRDVYRENVYKKQGGGPQPVKWMAIEALMHQVYSTYSDVWSFGILLWEIVTLGGSPYPEIPTNEVLIRLKSGYRMERPANCSLPLYNVMLSCWRTTPQSRPTFTILREELDKLLCMAARNDYLDLNDVWKGSPPEEENIHSSSPDDFCLPLELTYVTDIIETVTAGQDYIE